MKIIQLDKSQVAKEYGYLKRQHPEIFQIPSHTNAWEKSLIHKLCRKLPSRSTIVEIGSHLGATSLAMGIAAIEIKSRVFCVDTWDNRGMPGEQKDIYNDFLLNTGCNLYEKGTPGNAIYPYRATSLEASRGFGKDWGTKDGKVNLIFFDADHSYEAITGDIKAWLPLCAPRAWLVFHDHSGKYGRPAIQRAVEELVWPVQAEPGYILESIYYCRLKLK